MIEGIAQSIGNNSTTGHLFVKIRVRSVAQPAIIREVEAMLDTGFTGYLTLPENILSEIGAMPVGIQSARTGDGNITRFRCYRGVVEWDGEERKVRILHSQTFPLVGMNLLWGLDLAAALRHEGRVSIG